MNLKVNSKYAKEMQQKYGKDIIKNIKAKAWETGKINEIAIMLNVTTSYSYIVFEKLFNLSFTEYRVLRRIEITKQRRH